MVIHNHVFGGGTAIPAAPDLTASGAGAMLAGSVLLMVVLLAIAIWAAIVAARAKTRLLKGDKRPFGRCQAQIAMTFAVVAFVIALAIDVYLILPRAVTW